MPGFLTIWKFTSAASFRMGTPSQARLYRLTTLPADHHKGAPVEGQVFSVAFADGLPLCELGLAQGFGLVHAAEPFLVEQRHQFLRLLVGNRPHAHHHGVGACLLQPTAQSEYAFAVALAAQPRFARA